jgi:hypothetical protein
MDEFSNIWIEQCDAAREIRDDWGTRNAILFERARAFLLGGAALDDLR